MAKEETQTYVVIAPGVTTVPGQRKAHKIGAPVELTEKQAAGRVNKVRLKSEADKLAGGGKDIDAALLKRATEAEADLSAIQAKYDTGTKEIKELRAQVANAGGGKAPPAATKKKITDLESKVADLTAPIGEMEIPATEGGAKIASLEADLEQATKAD